MEAQLALKEARREIQNLQEVVESVRANVSVREQDPHDQKPNTVLKRAQPGGKSRSCGCSPASTLTRGSAFTRLSSEALQPERSTNAPEATRTSRPMGQTHLLLEAALLSQQLPSSGYIRGPTSVPRSSTYERLCSGGAVLPISHSCQTLSSTCKCSGHTYLPHHHLFLHLPQEEAPTTLATASVPASDPITTPTGSAEKKPEVRSQACSPTMTWLGDDIFTEELSVISSASADVISSEPPLFQPSIPHLYTSEHSHSLDPPTAAKPEEAIKTRTEAHTSQPLPAAPLPVQLEATVLETDEDHVETDGPNDDKYPSQVCHWSRYFLVDLLALAMPVVPTMAWLCRGAPQEVMPVYHIGSLLRGCCVVALHSLRRRGAGRGSRAASINGTTQISD